MFGLRNLNCGGCCKGFQQHWRSRRSFFKDPRKGSRTNWRWFSDQSFERREVVVDRSSLFNKQIDGSHLKPSNPLERHLVDLIQMRGPIPLGTFMREVLVNPAHGFYMNRDVLGPKGDFITSPEISQIFGELIGIWFISIFENMSKSLERNEKIRIIELGPGRGSLMSDMLRTWSKIEHFKERISIHLVEMSPAFRKIQAANLTNDTYPDPNFKQERTPIPPTHTSSTPPPKSSLFGEQQTILGEAVQLDTNFLKQTHDIQSRALPTSHKRTDNIDPEKEKLANPFPDFSTTTKDGIPICWHLNFRSIPSGPAFVIAHEFFDALPVHQFQLTDKGWRERLIDINSPPTEGSGSDRSSGGGGSVQNEGNQYCFKFVLANNPTVASTAFLKGNTENFEPGDTIEISPESLSVAQDIGTRLSQHGGAALIIDYGYNHPSKFSLRAIRDHKFVDVFDQVGTADLSCVVDFSSLARAAKTSPAGKPLSNIHSFGPITQTEYLMNMAIEARMASLLQSTYDDQQAHQLISAYHRLLDKDEMGTIYKFLGLISDKALLSSPPGFT